MSDTEQAWPSARDDYPKLHANTSGAHHQGQTSQEAQALLDEVDRLRDNVYNLARLATQRSERDVQLYVNRIAHRDRSTGFGERIRSLISKHSTTTASAGGTDGEIGRLRRWQYEACTAIHAATVIGQRHGVGFNYANHDRLLDEAGWNQGNGSGSGGTSSGLLTTP